MSEDLEKRANEPAEEIERRKAAEDAEVEAHRRPGGSDVAEPEVEAHIRKGNGPVEKRY